MESDSSATSPESPNWRPKLRAIDVRPVMHEDEAYFLLRDPQQLSDEVLLVPQALGPALSLFDGSWDAVQIESILTMRYGLELPPGLTAYPPRPETSERVESGALVSKQTWTYVLVPDRAGELEVPSISLAYFDPRAGRYATAGSRALPLSVHAAPPAVPTAPAPAATPAAAASPAGRPLLWIAGGLAVAALIALGFLAGRRTARADAPPRRRLLAALDAAAREPARTAAEGFDAAWRGYLAERWGVAADTPIAALPDRLRERGVPGDAAAAILALFEEIEYLRQAPELSDVGHLREEVVARSRTLLRELR